MRYPYSIRTGLDPSRKSLTLAQFRWLFGEIYDYIEQQGFLYEAVGQPCRERESVPGYMGENIAAYALIRLRKESLFPFVHHNTNYTEADLFDIIEFVYEHISKPVSGETHTFYTYSWIDDGGDEHQCLHYTVFEKKAAQEIYRQRVNEVLNIYGSGWELSDDGEVLALVDEPFQALFDDEATDTAPSSVHEKLNRAKRKYRRHGADAHEKMEAVRLLADILEELRPRVKDVLFDKDEDDLFVLANKFGIRHYKADQKTQYDKAIWSDWMFIYYLNTIRTVIRLMEREGMALASMP